MMETTTGANGGPVYCRRRTDPPCPPSVDSPQRPHRPHESAITPHKRRATDVGGVLRAVRAVQEIAEHLRDTGTLPDEETMSRANRLLETHNHIANVLGNRGAT